MSKSKTNETLEIKTVTRDQPILVLLCMFLISTLAESGKR